MPKLVLPLPETYVNITRPVIHDIVRKIMKDTHVDLGTSIVFPDHAEAVQQKNSSLDSPNGQSTFGNNEQVKIEYKESYNEEYFLANVVDRPEYPFIFRDSELPMNVRPIYGKQNVELTLAFRFRNKNQANKWRDAMALHLHRTGPTEIFSLSYHYLIPFECIYILQQVHALREKQAGYGEDFETYLKKHMTERLTQVSPMDGHVKNWAIAETQSRIVGSYDFSTYPEEGSKDTDSETWTISFNYKFTYEKPVANYLNYPLMVHNQLLPKKLRPEKEERIPFNPDLVKSYHSESVGLLRNFETAMDHRPYVLDQGYSFPMWDEFIPATVLSHTRRIMTVLCKITPTDRRSLMNLFTVEDMHYDPDVLALLKSEIPWITQYCKSLFNVALYVQEHQASNTLFTVQADGNIVANADLDLRKTYHIRLSVIDDLRLLPPDVIDRIREHGKGLEKIIEYTHPTYPGKIELIEGYVPKKTIEDINRDTAQRKPNNHQIYQFNTVGFITVESMN